MERVQTTFDDIHLGEYEPVAVKTGTASRRWRVVMALLVLVGSTYALLWAVRSESVVGGLLDERLDKLRDLSGVRVVRSDIEPVGTTGVALRDIIIRRPDEGGSLWIAVERVEIYPDLLAALTFDFRPGKIVLDGVEANFVAGKGEGGDLALVRQIRAAWAGKGGEKPVGEKGKGGMGLSRLPEIELRRSHVRVEDLEARFPNIVFDSERLAVDKEARGPQFTAMIRGDVDIVGYGRGELDGEFSVPSREGRVSVLWPEHKALADVLQRHVKEPMIAEASIQAKGVGLHWPPAVTLNDVLLEGIDVALPWTVEREGQSGRPRVTGVEAASLTVSKSPARLSIRSRDAVIVGVLPGIDDHRVPVGHAQVEVDRIKSKVVASVDFHDELGLGSANLRWDVLRDHLELTAKVKGVPIAPYTPLTPAFLNEHLRMGEGKISGSMVLDVRADLGLVELHTDAALSEGALRAPILSSEPLEGVNLGLKGHVLADLASGLFTLEEGVIKAGALEIEAKGQMMMVEGDNWTLSLDAKTSNTDAQAALDGLPEGLVPVLAGYKLAGGFDGALKMRLDTRRLKDLVLDVDINSERVEVLKSGPLSPVSDLAGDFKLKPRALPGDDFIGPGVEGWVSLADIPKVVPQAITAAEDGKFFKHKGFDLGGIRVALMRNVERGALVRGGSTISQQVIKNLFLSHQRTVSRKLQEVFLTWHLEETISKERILEIYLNMLHLGPGIYGVREASRVLFRKQVERLSLRESVFLGSILPNPDRFVRLYSKRRIPPDRRIKMRNILNSMMLSGFIGELVKERASSLTDQGVISIASPPSFEKL